MILGNRKLRKYYGARYYNPKWSSFISVDPLAEKYPSISGYAYCANNPINCVDPDGRDIIYLNNYQAVGVPGLMTAGHGAVLIGNDKEGWRYLSMNGTVSGSSPFGRSRNADLGTTPYDSGSKTGNDFRGTGLTLNEVIQLVNKSNPKEQHNYDRAVRIETNSFED